MGMRRFTGPEERALARLHGLPGTKTTVVVTHDQPSLYERLAKKGLATVILDRGQKRARLTSTGRYFAKLVSAVEKGRR